LVEQAHEGPVVEPGGAGDAGTPLGAEIAEQAPGQPVLGPDFDGVEAIVGRIKEPAGNAVLGLAEIGRMGGLRQFPKRPAVTARA